MRVIVLAGLAGCAYSPGSVFSSSPTFAGQQATLGCIDLEIERRPDLPTGSAVVSYSFGNRCDHPAVVDLAAIAVVGRTEKSQQVLAAYDPDHEIEVLRIDGRAVGREVISYQSDTPMQEVCIDVASIVHAPPARWLCLSAKTQIAEAL
jgi:hypothetical protein